LGCFLLALAGAPSSGKARLATATTQFQVTANALVARTISATDLNFGDYVPPQPQSQSQITVTCTNTAQWAIGLNAGTCPGATVLTRGMTGPLPFHLNYNLATDGTGAINWGETVGDGRPADGHRLWHHPCNQDVGPGGYVDTISAKITF